MTDPKIYDDRYYQKIHDLETRHWWHLGMRRIAASLIESAADSWTPERAFDAGCGTGNNIRWMTDILGATSSFGADIALHGLRLGRERGIGTAAQASILNLPFESECFDFVLCEDVLQHLPVEIGEREALMELRRVLRDKGWLLLRANSRLGFGSIGKKRDEDYQRYTLGELTTRLNEAGFIVRRATYANCLPSLYAIIRDRLRRAPDSHHHAHDHDHDHGDAKAYSGHNVQDTAALSPRLNKVLLSVMSLEAKYLSNPARRLPFGHTTFCLAQRGDNDSSASSDSSLK